ncbi:MAG: COX15/CtaA family protein [Alphaproteobacteria bacterium]|nr:COX15/CtaA family protein [Alphaproteobacteria bacterium]
MSSRRLAWFFTGLTALTYLLVVFGAVVRTKGAGLACPDWPLCFGQLVPAMDFGVILEWGHRALAGIVSLGLLTGIVATWRNKAALQAVRGLLVAAVVVLAVQIVLGGLTVLHLLAFWTVSSHLVVGNAFALTLGLIAARLWGLVRPERPRAPTTAAARLTIHVTAVALFAQLVLGGLVSSQFAGLVCPQWPACAGDQWFPTFSGLMGLHIAHRLTAYALVVGFALSALTTWGQDSLGAKARIAFGLVLAQVALGVANVLFHLPVEVTAGHSAGAALLILTTGLMLHDLYGRPLSPPVASTMQPSPERA